MLCGWCRSGRHLSLTLTVPQRTYTQKDKAQKLYAYKLAKCPINQKPPKPFKPIRVYKGYYKGSIKVLAYGALIIRKGFWGPL